MTKALRIVADWEPLDEGSAEERSCFAALGVEANGIWLTEGRDALANRLRQAPLLSAYHLAEWLAWNWWRLRWEPRAPGDEWKFAHKVSSVGGGYIWPNVTIFSDGERTALIAQATRERPGTPFRYINDAAAVIPSSDFESEVDNFLDQVLNRLESMGVRDTNLARLWADVCQERRNPELARLRKLEALLGSDPDESNAEILDRLVSDAAALGLPAIEEIAADHGQRQAASVPSAAELARIAQEAGFAATPPEMVSLPPTTPNVANRSDNAAWRVGALAAQAIRVQERLGDQPISDERLTEMLAVEKGILSRHRDTATVGISYALDEDGRSRIVLRSKWPEGRRFELARLLGDRLLSGKAGLYPATRAYTYRQKAQRSFAAELLSPFDAILGMLQGDYSPEKQLDVARHFEVSELTIRTQLVNRKILEREDLDSEAFAAAA